MVENLKIFGNPEKMFVWRIEKDGEKENISITEHGRTTDEHEKDLKIVRGRILKNTTPEMVTIIKENSMEYVRGDFKTRICKAAIIERIFELATTQKEINLKILVDKESSLKAEQKIYGKHGQIYES